MELAYLGVPVATNCAYTISIESVTTGPILRLSIPNGFTHQPPISADALAPVTFAASTKLKLSGVESFTGTVRPAMTASSTGLVLIPSVIGVVLTPFPRSKVDPAGKDTMRLKPEAFDQPAFNTRPVTFW